jgi:hypothetical protein
MQTVNSLLSNEVGYLNALRNAVPFPETKAPEMLPPATPQLPIVIESSLDRSMEPRSSKIPALAWVYLLVAGIGVAYLLDLNRKKEKAAKL